MRQVVFFTQAYNAEKTLRRAVDSILAQTYTNFVYYIVDNGSTDGTGEMIQIGRAHV
jgi:glycosyltransferase involved in cell wall biosynthesis